MKNTCSNCNRSFVVQNSDLTYYQRINVPKPTVCPPCREARRMAWCNEGTLYFAECALCKKKVMSQFSPESARTAYCRDCWWSDSWNPLDYASSVDFERPILSQLKELLEAVPHCHTHTDLSSENSEYSHHAGHQKNCYMTFHCSFAEDCYYGYGIKKATSCVDCHYCHESELCFECIDVLGGYDLAWCQECRNCSSSRFLYDCIGCKNCFLCTGLRNQEYCFLNEKMSRREYQSKIAAIDLGSWKTAQIILKKYLALRSKHTRKCMQTLMTENCIGNNLYNSRDCYLCFDSSDLEYCNYCSQIQFGARHCHDIYQFGIEIEMCFDCAMIGYNIYNCRFCYDLLEQCSNLEYCLSCHSTKDCLACFGLKRSQYCILNKQYSKEDYHALRRKIIDKMKAEGTYGSFLPISFSPHAYNETIAQQWYPKTREEISSLGLRWQDNLPYSTGGSTIAELPDNTAKCGKEIIREVIACRTCSRDYKIAAREFSYYQRCRFPLPRECFSCRIARRAELRDARKIYKRKCQSCKKDTFSTLTAPRNILCESCHQDMLSKENFFEKSNKKSADSA